MTEQALAIAREHSALDIYGGGDDIKKMAARIKMCLPGGNRLNDGEALSLAQLSISYNLNPFNGEVWHIPGKGTMVGIKGLRKAARRNKEEKYWIEHVLLTPEERTQLSIPPNAVAYKALLYRSDLIRHSAESIKLMHEAGMKDAAERYAYKPAVGIGYWVQGESTKMKGDQAARKRAEAEALKIAFDLPFASEIGNGDTVGYIDAEEWEVLPSSGGASPEKVERNSRQLYGDPDFEGFDTPPETAATAAPVWEGEVFAAGEDEPEPDPTPPAPAPAPTNGNTRPLDPEKVRAFIRKKAGWQDGHRLMDGEPMDTKEVPRVATVMGELFPNLDNKMRQKARHDVLRYLIGVDSTKALTMAEALAITDWSRDQDSAQIEAARILEAIAIEAGQQELPL